MLAGFWRYFLVNWDCGLVGLVNYSAADDEVRLHSMSIQREDERRCFLGTPPAPALFEFNEIHLNEKIF